MHAHSASLEIQFKRATEAILARVLSFAASDSSDSSTSPASPAVAKAPQISLAVAYSGGLDSSVLLHLAQRLALQEGWQLYAFHIHHGLSPQADQWMQHCAAQCERIGVAFSARCIEIGRTEDSGVEEAARLARYAALGDLCCSFEVPLLLTAHHQDDQAETVLLQLFRGSGVAGLSGMQAVHTAPTLLGDERLLLGRPLLDFSRSALEVWARAQRISHIEDESNTNPRFARNALRLSVMPVLQQVFPGFAQRIARTAGHMRAARTTLDAVAAQDLLACSHADSLDLDRLRDLPTDRIDLLLRHWFGVHSVRLPSTAWLQELREQLLDADADAQPCIIHPDCEVRRHRQRAYLLPRAQVTEAPIDQHFRWQGQMHMDFLAFGGRLHFEQTDCGFDSAWLMAQELRIHRREGGERLRLALNRPSRSIKQHCQTLDIPPWEREAMVFVAAGQQLLYAAGIGMDGSSLGADSGPRIALRWQPIASLLE